jgi:acetylornithine deacetylase/succinyl-diaminopimelate desuccinylase-like protein
MIQAALAYTREHHQEALQQLVDLISIPSISTLPDHANDIHRAAEWLATHLQEMGLEHVRVLPTARHPVVYADWLHAPDKPTVLIYGHYDVQPVDPLDEWETPPFEPTVRGDHLYARGASDDKGQLFTHLKAIEALLRAEGRLPINVKLLIEGEEEIGSSSLKVTLPEHRDLFQADVCAISDSHILSPDQPSIVYGLRGMVYGEVEVQGPHHDLHSGSFGGAVHNPLTALCEMIAALHDAQGRVTIPGFYDRVRTLSDEESAELARLPFTDEQFKAETGISATWGESGYTTLERLGARPTLEIHGIRGGFTGEGAKTVIPAKALAKISMRLVPHQSSAAIAKLFQNHVESLTPKTVRVSVRVLQSADPVLIDRRHPAFQAASKAYEKSFGARPVYTLEGGSIPIAVLLQRLFKLPVVLMGFGLPDDRLHSPNEKFYLPNFYRGIECCVHFLAELGKEE